MTVQELIDVLNKVEDKSKLAHHRLVYHHNKPDIHVDEIIERNNYVIIY